MEARLMKGHTTARVVVIAGLVAAIGAGCSSSAKSSSPTTTTLPVETKGFQVETPGGQVSLSLDGLLPPNWPANFPVAPNAAPAGSASRCDTAQTSLVGAYSSTHAPDETYRFYASTPAYHVDSKSSISPGSVFVGKVTF